MLCTTPESEKGGAAASISGMMRFVPRSSNHFADFTVEQDHPRKDSIV
jgi:hypothetical protein